MRAALLAAAVLAIWILSMRRAAASTPPRAAGRAPGRSVVTYNIQRLPWIRKGLEPLRELTHSVIFLQECFFRWTGEKLESLFPDYHVCRGALKGLRLVDSGLAILSRHPILESEFVPFRAGNRASLDILAEKGFLSALVRIDGAPLRLVNTHLQSSSGEYDPQSFLQLEELFAYLDGLKEPYLLGGDFNIDVHELKSRFPNRAVFAPEEPTIYLDFKGASRSSPARGFQGRTYDYFLSPSVRCAPSVLHSDFSDHRPVETLISFGGTGREGP